MTADVVRNPRIVAESLRLGVDLTARGGGAESLRLGIDLAGGVGDCVRETAAAFEVRAFTGKDRASKHSWSTPPFCGWMRAEIQKFGRRSG